MESQLGIDHTDFETAERPRKELDFDELRNDGIMYAHPTLLVISKKNCNTSRAKMKTAIVLQIPYRFE